MFDEMTPMQRAELFEYAAIEPFGEQRADLRNAYLIKTYIDARAGKGGKKLTLGDLTLYPDLAQKQSGDDLRSHLESMVGSGVTRG